MTIQNSNLPPSFVNEVVKIAEDETIVQSKLKSVSHVYSWIEEYGRTSDTKWNLRSSIPSRTRLVYWLRGKDKYCTLGHIYEGPLLRTGDRNEDVLSASDRKLSGV
ncbi:hypothetical protein AVEN_39614-1 [Araneus ventricosus]|uniref:Uncharacterized protein n=1 Tax=Araneus ventricosus TaxID=182803 RepID=A0A4Y2CTE0_ARAVE|nr:hypothetical protein AVEN_39614-1 [Araneus ventricosus]